MEMNKIIKYRDSELLILALIITIAVGALGIYETQAIQEQLNQADERLAEVDTLEKEKTELEEELANTQEELEEAKEENEDLEDDLEDAEEKNDDFEEQIEDIESTVGEISRYTSVDPEILKKYSRVFFLSENYAPTSLAQIDEDFLYDDDLLLFHRQAYPFLEEMLEEAQDDGIDLRIISAYRSFQTQQGLNDRYTITYGTGANEFSAEQGYSEHQLGTTIDFTTPGLGSNFTRFDTTEAYDWLLDNAHEYGFILSYPEGNQYYQYEPWHWRFVGVELAEDLEDSGDHFYDWEQRRIDEYRGEIFQD